ncbi:precorrin-8X methylmutase [Cohaesibacter haloalkalitolerans]|uniref:precorrin-8X methylmutase n=1 Tax=Cohaesibacter haloalkalitolerans TaxID=1162980 RepID=UPI000E65130D|nr:precorrin-8X methylmutase [Cohaesibacter haloalkalitolerans]
MTFYNYEKDPAAIYASSFNIIRQEAGDALATLPQAMEPVAVRLMHSVGMTDLVADMRFSPDAADAGIAALRRGTTILVDTRMVAGGISQRFFAEGETLAANRILVTLTDPEVALIAEKMETTRSAAAMELWRPHLEGAIVAIGNAPTALFRLLEMVREGAGRPALVLGFPVGFVGAAESKQALVDEATELGLDYIAMLGRRGGTPMASAAVNALAIAALGQSDRPM